MMAFQAYGNTSIRIVFATALLLAIGPLRGRPTISTIVDLPAHDWSTKGLLDPGYCGPVLYLYCAVKRLPRLDRRAESGFRPAS
jgi:hypothetical protein